MKRTPFLVLWFLILFLRLACTAADADWISFSGAENAPNIAEIRIQEDYVKIELEIFVNNMVAFDRLIPDQFFEDTDIRRPPLADRMRRFSREDFQIIDDKGEKLQATLKLVEPRLRNERPSPYAGKINPYTLEHIPGPPQDKRVLYAELVYPFTGKPSSLTFVPPLAEEGNISRVPIGFITYHEGVPINDFRFLSEASTLTLDWEDPWYSEFDSKALNGKRRMSTTGWRPASPETCCRISTFRTGNPWS